MEKGKCVLSQWRAKLQQPKERHEAQAGEPCRAQGVTEAMGQAPFQAIALFQVLANYPYSTSNSKFHLIQFKFQHRSLQRKQAGSWGPGESTARGCAGLNPCSQLLQWRQSSQTNTHPPETPPLGTHHGWSCKAHLSCHDESQLVGIGVRYWWTQFTHCHLFHTGSHHHHSRRLSAKSVFSTRANPFLWWISVSSCYRLFYRKWMRKTKVQI